MKIGLYGGIANNMYVMARGLERQGIEVCFIRDRQDCFAFSQPVWEDIPFTLTYDDLPKTVKWSWAEWAKREEFLGWCSPDWLFDPLNRTSSKTVKASLGLLDRMLFHISSEVKTSWRATLELMKLCDILIVCGIDGTILAWASGKPFVLWPHGGDARTALGLQVMNSRNPRAWMAYYLTRRFLRSAYERALCVGTHCPSGLDWDLSDPTLKFTIELLPIPVRVRDRLERSERRALIFQLMERLGQPMPEAEWILFVPSRIDFFWKKTDLLLKALAHFPRKSDLHLIFSGWGTDYEKAREMILPHHATFLPCAVSKPILYDFFRAADVVVDQFRMGIYGTSAVEAMSCSAPVMMWIDKERFQSHGWDPPPVLNGKNEEEIVGILGGILSGRIDLEKHARAALDWVIRTHGEEVMLFSLKRILTKYLPSLPIQAGN